MNEKQVTTAEAVVTDRFVKSKRVYFVAGALLMVALILINVGVYLIPGQYTTVNVNPTHPSSLSQTSRDFVGGIDKDVTVYCLCSDGMVSPTYKALLQRYESLNSHITVKPVNTTKDTGFSKAYTESELSNNSLIIEGPVSYLVLDYADLFYFTNDYVNYMSASATDVRLSYEDVYYLQSIGDAEILSGIAYYGFETYSQAEAKITSALDYVTQSSGDKDYTSPYESINAMLVATDYLDRLSGGVILVWGLVMAIAIPLGLLITGFVIRFRRSRR
jgi:hypothetical protein